jgi:hypothetical protein
MADESVTIRGINWREAFPFTNLFRAFRVAIHPSKIVLALVALLLLYVGGRVLDGLWSVNDRAVPNELSLYEAFQRDAKPGQKFSDIRKSMRDAVEADYASQLMQAGLVIDQNAALKAAHEAEDLGKLKDVILKKRDDDAATAKKAHDDRAIRDAYESANQQYQRAKRIKNEGLFKHYFDYESNQVSNVVWGVRDWNWLGEEHFDVPAAIPNPLGNDIPVAPAAYGRPGVIQAVTRFFTVGPLWLLTQHTLYFALSGAWFLVVWAIFGGAICRIAAVHIARDEKMSIRSALKFSVGKFLSFLFAPIIPLLIVVAVGLLVTIGSLVGNIPFLGPIVIGALFFIALAAGFVMALVSLGLVGGFNLMYPTIAVEGSDSFDAISRSFSYLYARPWRLAFYTIVSVIYGALTYLFVRLFIYLMLVLAHKFVGAGMFLSADSTAPLWSTMWPSPTTAARLSYDIDFLSLDVGPTIGALLVSFWVYLVIAVLGAFVISFYFSSNTIIYYLMRREVDATEMDDVYLEQVDDEFAEPTPAGEGAAKAETATPTPAVEPSAPA